MRSKVLLIFDIYNLKSFFLMVFVVTIFRDINAIVLINLPILFLFLGSIADIVRYLIIFSNSIYTILQITCFYIQSIVPHPFHLQDLIYYIFRPPILNKMSINNMTV